MLFFVIFFSKFAKKICQTNCLHWGLEGFVFSLHTIRCLGRGLELNGQIFLHYYCSFKVDTEPFPDLYPEQFCCDSWAECGWSHSLWTLDRTSWWMSERFVLTLHREEPPLGQISLFMGDVTPRKEVSEEGKHKDKSSGRRLIFITDKQPAGEGFLQAAGSHFLCCSSLFSCILISINSHWDHYWAFTGIYSTPEEKGEWLSLGKRSSVKIT